MATRSKANDPTKPKAAGAGATPARIAGEPGDLPLRSYCGGALTLATEQRFSAGGTRGGAQRTSDQSIADDSLVEIELEGGVTLWTSFARLKEDFPTDPASRAAQDAGPGTYVFPAALPLGDAARGGLTDWAVKAWNLLALKLDADGAAQLAARGLGWLLEHRIDQRQGLHHLALGDDNGLDRIAKAGPPPNLADVDVTRPLLVFLHGTGTSTAGSFAGLWDARNRDLRTSLAAAYGQNNVLALEHRSVSLSPLRNALDLALALPQGARLHLISHSRGGLIGELLARANRRGVAPFDDTDLAIVGEADAALLRQLRDVLQEKRLRVERFVRVACPARGTSLASGRLDRYLSVIVNVFKLASLGGRVPLLAELEDLTAFAAAVAQRRSDPSEFPGLEAMMPESRLIRMLNRPGVEVDSDLTVIAGDAEPQGILKRLALLVTDLYFDEEHDFVVNTANMSGGAARVGDAARMFRHKHADVSHFRYFYNTETSRRMVAGLLQPAGFVSGFVAATPFPAPPSRAARSPERGPRGPSPAVVVLPGIMGSALAVADGKSVDTVWMDFFDLARGGLCAKLALPDRQRVVAEHPLPRTYGRLLDFLADSHRVVPFAYDWRISLKDEAQRLAERILVELEQTERDNQPLVILTHSMGGLLARALLAYRPEVWQRVCRHPDARVLMLGTPTRGSHSITQVLAGQERMITLLAALDLRDTRQQILDTVSRFPGVLELLPDARRVDSDGGTDSLLDANFWAALPARQRREFTLPDDALLAGAAEVRARLAQTRFEPGRLVYVAGRADETPVDFIDDDGELAFTASNQGDGRVPWQTGIPADAAQVYYLDAVHGDMADTPEAFGALAEILRSGRTAGLPQQAPASARGAATRRIMRRPPLQAFPDEASLEIALRGGAPRRRREQATAPQVRLVVRHGDLRYACNPLVVGHYFGDGIVSAEKALDRFLDHRLSARLQVGLYPGLRNTAEVFINPDAAGPSAIVIGLGAVGELTVGALAECFAAGLLRYAVQRAEGIAGAQGEPVCVAALLIGTGGGGLGIDDSLTGLLRGMRRAVEALAGGPYAGRVSFAELELIELYEDRAIAAVHALRRLTGQAEFRDRFAAPTRLEARKGGLRRAMFDEPPGWWQRLLISPSEDGGLRFVSLTQRARAEARLQALQRPLVDRFLEQARAGTATDESLGVTLFELLLPNELKQFAPDQGDLVLIVDEASARYPWELLRDRTSREEAPMVVERGVLRQLQSDEYRRNPVNCRNNRALVIGDPLSKYPELPGAQREAEAVAAALQAGEGAARFDVTCVLRENARTILRELMDHDYRIVHLAGHGVFEFPLADDLADPRCEGGKRKPRTISGMVIGDNIFLTPVEVRQMRQVPELVFINCCHLGRVEPDSTPNDWFVPYRLAANLAVEFIRMGVRAVIAAGWEVDDQAGRVFAETFYRQMLTGERFGTAIQQARRETWEMHRQVNTWGAYQCYGDPDFRFGVPGSAERGAAEAPPYVAAAEAEVDLHNLACAIGSADPDCRDEFAVRIATVERRLSDELGGDGALRARLAGNYFDSGDFANALRCYRLVPRSELLPQDIERYANTAARRAGQLAANSALAEPGKSRQKRGRRQDADDPSALAAMAVELLDGLLAFAPTVERHNIMGSAQKRLALLARDAAGRREALSRMALAYASAAALQQVPSGTPDGHAAINAWTAQIILAWHGGRAAKEQPKLPAMAVGLPQFEALAADSLRNEDFWARALAGDCALLRLIAKAAPAAADIDAVVRAYRGAAKLGAGPREWNSVLSQVEILKELAGSSDQVKIAAALQTLHSGLQGAA
jgi:hypothetical protein